MSSSPVSTSVKGLLAGRFSCPTGGIWATVIKKKKKGKKEDLMEVLIFRTQEIKKNKKNNSPPMPSL